MTPLVETRGFAEASSGKFSIEFWQVINRVISVLQVLCAVDASEESLFISYLLVSTRIGLHPFLKRHNLFVSQHGAA